MSGNKEGGARIRARIIKARPAGTIRGDKVTVFVRNDEFQILQRISQRSNLSAAGVVRALIHLHAEDTIHVQQTIHVDTVVRAEKP